MILNTLYHINKIQNTPKEKKETSFKAQIPIKNVAEISKTAAGAIAAAAIGFIQLQKTLKDADTIRRADTGLLFTPIESLQEKFLIQLSEIESVNGDFPEALRQKMIEAVENGNFNLKVIYDDYYSTLSLCENLEEVGSIYPEMTFPKTPKTSEQEKGPAATDEKTPLHNIEKNKSALLKIYALKPQKRYHDKGDIDRTKEFLNNYSSFQNIDGIIDAAKMINTKDRLPKFMQSFLNIYKNSNPEYLTEDHIIGLFTVMSQFRPKQNLNILNFYKMLIDKPYGGFRRKMINTLSSGKNSWLAENIGNCKNDDELKQLLNILDDWETDSYMTGNMKTSLELYSISRNKEVLSDLSRIFKVEKIKQIIEKIKENQNASEILDNYKSHIQPERHSLTREELTNVLYDLGITDEEDINAIIDSLFMSYKRSTASKKNFVKRFEGKDFDKSVIAALKQIYIDLKPLYEVTLPIDENDFGYAKNFNRNRDAASSFNTPNSQMLKVINQADHIHKSLLKVGADVENFDDFNIKSLARVNSTKNYWRDFNRVTKYDWMPIRFIKDKRYNEETYYTLDNLVDSYLYSLYLQSVSHPETKKKYSPNPLARISSYPFLTKRARNIIYTSYMNIYNAKHEQFSDIYFADKKYIPSGIFKINDFNRFCEENHFDKNAIADSLQKIENIYRRKFYIMYHNENGRAETLQKDLNESLNLIYEKIKYANSIKTNVQPATLNDVKDLTRELEEFVLEEVDTEKLNKFKFIVKNIENPELKTRCQSCISNACIDKTYFDYIYDILQKSTVVNEKDGESLNEIKALVLLKLHDKFVEESDEYTSEKDFISNELKEYNLENDEYDYNKYYNDTKSELDFYSLIGALEYTDGQDFSNYMTECIINNPNFSYNSANELMSDFIQFPPKMRDLITQITKQSNKCFTDAAINDIKSVMEMVKTWHFDSAEIIIINDAGVDKKVIITPKAKDEVWEKYNGNYIYFDQQIKKYYKAANKYAPEKNAPGIKNLYNGGAELKIKGDGGGMRMYTRPITPEDYELYKIDENDTMPIKYIFDKYDHHL